MNPTKELDLTLYKEWRKTPLCSTLTVELENKESSPKHNGDMPKMAA